MAEMHSLNFENLIANFIKIYLNPRCDLSNLNIISKKWIFERITIEEETISHSFYLKFLINKKFYSSEFVKMKFLNNLVKSNTNLDESIFNIINSFFKSSLGNSFSFGRPPANEIVFSSIDSRISRINDLFIILPLINF